jgi:hypothetical protein
MNEKFLQYLWQFKRFNVNNVLTTDGEPIQIIAVGQLNSNQGPDFLNATIKIGDTTLAGSVELHVKASQWNLHKHNNDANYGNVILHVVWEEDIKLPNTFPCLVLQPLVPKLLLDNYKMLMQTQAFIPCEKLISTVPALTTTIFKERLFVERLQQKSKYIIALLEQNNYHWEQVFWQVLAKTFGYKVNADAFESIAASIDITVLAKHKQQINQLEALLLGQAGLLIGEFNEHYPTMLQKEYHFLRSKYKLQASKIAVQFLRMRPANFPTVRLAQLAALVQQSNHLFSKIKEIESIKELKKCFSVTANDYWHTHYVLNEPTAFLPKKLGKQMVENIIINTVLPMLFTYAWHTNSEALKQKVIEFARQLSAEKNVITTGYADLGLENKNAFDSQALIQLKNNYCNQKLCLQCSVGASIFK